MTNNKDKSDKELRHGLSHLSKEDIRLRLHRAKIGNALFRRQGTILLEQLERRIRRLAAYHDAAREKVPDWLAQIKVLRLSQDMAGIEDLEHEIFDTWCKEHHVEELSEGRSQIECEVVGRHIDSLSKSIEKQNAGK